MDNELNAVKAFVCANEMLKLCFSTYCYMMSGSQCKKQKKTKSY